MLLFILRFPDEPEIMLVFSSSGEGLGRVEVGVTGTDFYWGWLRIEDSECFYSWERDSDGFLVWIGLGFVTTGMLSALLMV